MARPALLLACAFALGSLTIQAQDRVYTWTDAQGVVHYSQTEPDKGTAQARDIKNPPAKPLPPKPKTADEIACERATLSLDMLGKKAPLTIDKNGDGKTEPMTSDDRTEAAALARRQIDTYCPKK